MAIPIESSVMTPKETVHELDRFIIGQDDAKRAGCYCIA